MAETIQSPNPPQLLPRELQAKWKKDYEIAYREAEQDQSLDDVTRRQAALREANRILRVPEPKSYAEAKALADWQVLARFELDGELRGVTIDMKKFRFPVPRQAVAPALAPHGAGPAAKGGK